MRIILILNAEFHHALHLEQAKLRLADQLRAMRAVRGWSQRQAAKLAGVAWRDLWRIENCYWRNINVKTLTAIAAAFDVAWDIRFIDARDALLQGDYEVPVSWAEEVAAGRPEREIGTGPYA